MRTDSTIFVAGSDTLIGAALVRQLLRQGFERLRGLPDDSPDFTDPDAVENFFCRHQPDYVFHAAGRSGGIAANQQDPAYLIRDNLLASIHVIHAAHQYGVRKLLYLASSCSYPRLCPQPMRVENLMTGPLEPTNAAYATAKLAGIALCQAYRKQHGDRFIVGIPANSFGPGDDYDSQNAHVIGALMQRMHAAKANGDGAVTIWGTGTPRREFIFADDLADACIRVMRDYDDEPPINLGSGSELSIAELAEMIRAVVGFPGRLEFDYSRPDGMPRKSLDGSRLAALGWRPATPLRQALEITYADFLETQSISTGICADA